MTEGVMVEGSIKFKYMVCLLKVRKGEHHCKVEIEDVIYRRVRIALIHCEQYQCMAKLIPFQSG